MGELHQVWGTQMSDPHSLRWLSLSQPPMGSSGPHSIDSPCRRSSQLVLSPWCVCGRGGCGS